MATYLDYNKIKCFFIIPDLFILTVQIYFFNSDEVLDVQKSTTPAIVLSGNISEQTEVIEGRAKSSETELFPGPVQEKGI